MSDDIIPREQAFAEARAIFDRALDRIARDRAAGRLTPEAEARIAAGERRYAARQAAIKAAAIREAARIWRRGMDDMDRMTVTAAARACHQPGGPSLAELEARITADRTARIRTAR
ncbi:hypothetical protein [Streptomyces sp. SID8499]|uniref:hypothetical protein n=1 Tax=Streptomyces sp. SID8499 TaxID=2706106 RepID=UPI0013CC9849|nr:hypothetical protein [Streptomyces sp. SID8499]NED35575.1 hypothetical protein [Streptomyces sp. SID8499]